MAAPFAVGALSVDPPGAFGFLMVYYFLAETWFAILFTVLVEIVPNEVRSVCIGWRTVVELPVKTKLTPDRYLVTSGDKYLLNEYAFTHLVT